MLSNRFLLNVQNSVHQWMRRWVLRVHTRSPGSSIENHRRAFGDQIAVLYANRPGHSQRSPQDDGAVRFRLCIKFANLGRDVGDEIKVGHEGSGRWQLLIMASGELSH